MTILFKEFRINVSANNVKCEANNKLYVQKGQKIILHAIQIAPGTNTSSEDVFITLYRDQEQLAGEGIYHAIIDDYTHTIEFDADAVEGQTFVTKAWGPNARTIHGVYMYEITS